MKVGDYVRTYHLGGSIEKIIEIVPKERTDDLIERYITDISAKYMQSITAEQIIKSNKDITELLEPMDLMYVDIDNGYEDGIIVPRIAETQNELDEYITKIKNKTWILSGVVTREQLQNNTYWLEVK